MRAEPGQRDHFVPEIQGLRAVAVLAVLVYHLWPDRLPGGFVGVDVFFVISGYLITALLLREFVSTQSIALSRFYARRALRLLPAASLVLLAVAFCLPLLPQVEWRSTAVDLGASTLYVQNWWLALQAVDYLASEHAGSALQHFWSLSVEEQYYLVWPLLLLVAARVWGRRKARPTTLFGAIIGVVFAVSLVYSCWLTPRNPGLAYFATTTRAWELALGGLLAVWASERALAPRAGVLAACVGLAMIGIAAFLIDASMAFPGYLALLPTLGAALVLAAGAQPGTLLRATLASRSMQYVGDLSYSLYLWHWPVIVVFQSAVGHRPDLVEGVALGAISLALAHQTKSLVEDRLRFLPALRIGARPFAFGAAAMACCLLVAVLIRIELYPASEPAAQQLESAQIAPAAADSSVAAPVSLEGLKPPLARARDDNPDVYAQGCHASPRSAKPSTCTWGADDATVHVMLVGDSHAAQWIPALQWIAGNKGWRLTSLTKSACPFADGSVAEGKGGEPYASCDAWNAAALAHVLAQRPALVVTSQAVMLTAYGSTSAASSHAALSAGLASRWNTLAAAGIRVVALKDTPRMGLDVPKCLGSPRGSAQRCSRPRSLVLATPDPLVMAQRDAPQAVLADLNDLLCPTAVCPPVIDGILVWRDSHHMTATFARTLAPTLQHRLETALAVPPSPDSPATRTDP
ncbi:peptidoglycan/LPS O-acetylase OafA/YrhL [Chiayiivirga flava]|uniref:Peptidoglycan/LPS O-acetylase OafA/YrhL n=1 Tax=Chiayiivirga flava TaxID=659595 RepID=A0A7W8D749_9GAMM|nr:peptidoglycan/LPS O-acetylase OafA/YrhL [Chiayiivirga flava]